MQFVSRLQTWVEQKITSNQNDESILKQSTQWAKSITWGLIATTGLTVSF